MEEVEGHQKEEVDIVGHHREEVEGHHKEEVEEVEGHHREELVGRHKGEVEELEGLYRGEEEELEVELLVVEEEAVELPTMEEMVKMQHA